MRFQQGDWVLWEGMTYRVRTSNPTLTVIISDIFHEERPTSTARLKQHQVPWVKFKGCIWETY